MKTIINIIFFFLFGFSFVHAQNDTTLINKKVNVAAKIISQPPLKFPEMAIKAGLQAAIYVKIYVSMDGKPYKTEIIKREPEFVYLFDKDVRKWAMKYIFSPALENNKPVPSVVVVPVNFKLNDFQPPEVKEEPKPEYPDEAVEMGMEGWVAVAVLVNPEGIAEGTVNIVSREPVYTDVFDNAAIAAAKNTTFIPAFTKGLASYGWKFLKIEFHLPPK
jgi:TonB family protein